MSKLKSRKLWVSIVSALLIIANQGLGLDLPNETILAFAGIVITYLLGQSAVDAVAAKR